MPAPNKHLGIDRRRLLFLTAALCVHSATTREAQASPAASTSSATHPDPFEWLEEIRGERALAWVRRHNERSLRRLMRNARYRRYYESALAIAQDKSRIPASTIFDGWLHDGWVYNLWQDEAHPRGLFRRARLDSYLTPSPDWQTLLDVDALGSQENRRWDLRSPIFLPPHGRRCMIGLVDGGEDAITYREFDLDRGAFARDGFLFSDARGSSLLWKNEDALLIAVSAENAPLIVKEWSRCQPLASAKVVFQGTTSNFGGTVQDFVDETGERSIVVIEMDPLRRRTHWLLNANGQFVQMRLPPDAQLSALHRGEWVFSISEDWTIGQDAWKAGSLLSASAAEIANSSSPTIRLVTALGHRETIVRTDGARHGVLAIRYANVRSQLLLFTFEGDSWRQRQISLPDNGAINFVMSDPAGGATFVRYESFLEPPTVYAVDVAAGEAVPAKSLPPQFDASRYVTEQREAVSRDGARVPYFLVRPKAMRARGRTPTLMRAYGYQGFSQFPSYSGFLGRLWLEQSGAYVLANIRGGGELGPDWHVAKTQRQLVYDDFVAVAEDLIRRGITSPRRLGIEGMSAGGLLMGVTLTQRPDLFNAAVVAVPVLDLLDDNLLGGRSRFAAELGSLDIPEERAFLERTSPYQNLRKRNDFPVPFLVTSTTDDRAHPAFARKFAAKMEALDMPFLYYESAEGGHNVWSTPQQHAMYEALFYTYLAQRLM